MTAAREGPLFLNPNPVNVSGYSGTARTGIFTRVTAALSQTCRQASSSKRERKMILPGGESNPALARSVGMTGACTNPIYYQGLR